MNDKTASEKTASDKTASVGAAAVSKVVVDLKTPMPASDDCLPHAAMTLGSVRGVGTRPMEALVSRLVIQQQMGQWCLYRLDGGGGFVGDTWHGSRDDALATAVKEFGQQVTDMLAALRLAPS